jgi:D-alanyl-D-alanine carboxypeptidase (penicillin-binding protein 5/6)
MRKIYVRRFLIFTIAIVFIFCVPVNASARLQIDSPSVILAEQTTGRVLYSRNERERRNPASLTKMLAALVVLEYLDLNDEIVIGQEIRGMPPGYGANIHSEGEVITVYMLLNSFLIRSSNETGRVLALNVARQVEGRRDVSYEQAEAIFSNLMNETARSLGARGTQFDNPFGFHSVNHFSTAYDLAIIARAFMDNPVLSEIAGTRIFENEDFSWTSTNQMLPHAPHGHPYVDGIIAGFNTPAGHVLATSAYNNGLGLAVIVLGGTDAARWQDARRLVDYGFTNFSFREISYEGEIIETVLIENPRRGDMETLEIISSETHYSLLSHEEFFSLTREIIYDSILYVENELNETILRAPIEDGMVIGRVIYRSGDSIIHETNALASREVIERSFDSDMDYFLAAFFGTIFSRRGLPYWFGFMGTAFGVFGITLAIKAHRRTSRKDVWTAEKYRKSRYSRYN